LRRPDSLIAIVRTVSALILSALLFAISAPGSGASPAREIAFSELPAEARQTLALIRSGGPFPYRQDGVEFGNREKHLPLKVRGHYREYTVKTPGARDRGARRIVAGAQPSDDVKHSTELWYTDDHYASFRRIVEAKGK